MANQLPRAVVVAIKLPEVSVEDFDASRRELTRLIQTLGYEVVSEISQQRPALAAAAALGEGKLQELAALTGGSGRTGFKQRPPNKARLKFDPASDGASGGDDAPSEDDELADEDDVDDELVDDDGGDASDGSGVTKPKIDLVAVDHDVSPSQLRNLERATGTNVLDRTGVIIEIFHRHAHSRKARLEVEIARLQYLSPRVRESPRGKERQQGRGAGEAALELDRRKIRDRIAELRDQLDKVQREEGVRRQKRGGARRIALVGYTNAGKSSWMRALTGSQVLVENKLFATLDTTVRALYPETRPRILVSDTVGFIKKLPHDLVASFKSTLDEALEASLLVYVVDAADPAWESQLEVTREVLREIGAESVPSRVLLNKVDALAPAEREALSERFPEALLVSSRAAEDVAHVRRELIAFFEAAYVEAELVVPYDRQRLVSEMHDVGKVLAEDYADDGVRVRLATAAETLQRLRSELARAN